MLFIQLHHSRLCCVQLPWSQFFASILFWLVLLGMKGAFDYWIVIKPLEPPIKALWNRGWLRGCQEITINGYAGFEPPHRGCPSSCHGSLRNHSLKALMSTALLVLRSQAGHCLLLTSVVLVLHGCCTASHHVLTRCCMCRKRSGVPCPDADFILVIARALPAFVLSLVDTGIFYTARILMYP